MGRQVRLCEGGIEGKERPTFDRRRCLRSMQKRLAITGATWVCSCAISLLKDGVGRVIAFEPKFSQGE